MTEPNEIRNAASTISDETILNTQQATVLIADEAGYNDDEIGLLIGRSNNTVRKVRRNVERIKHRHLNAKREVLSKTESFLNEPLEETGLAD